MCRQFPGRLVLGIDARDGRVATDGWLETSDVAATDAGRGNSPASRWPRIIYTDIATDGMLAGPNLAAMARNAAGGRPAGDRLGRRDDARRRGPTGRSCRWPAASSAEHCTKANLTLADALGGSAQPNT